MRYTLALLIVVLAGCGGSPATVGAEPTVTGIATAEPTPTQTPRPTPDPTPAVDPNEAALAGMCVAIDALASEVIPAWSDLRDALAAQSQSQLEAANEKMKQGAGLVRVILGALDPHPRYDEARLQLIRVMNDSETVVQAMTDAATWVEANAYASDIGDITDRTAEALALLDAAGFMRGASC